MGRLAQSAWIICVFVAIASAVSGTAAASAVAQGVALNAAAGCSNGNLDITLTTVGLRTLTAQFQPSGSGFAGGSGTAPHQFDAPTSGVT